MQLESNPPRTAEWTAVVLLSVATAGFLLLLSGMKTLHQIAIIVGIVGVLALTVLPNRRILLVAAFIFLHPLSLEKAFPVFGVPRADFLSPNIIVSASDVALFALAFVLIAETITTRGRPFIWPGAATPLALLWVWVVFGFLLIQPSPEGVLQVLHWLKLLLAVVTLSSAIRTRQEMLLVFAVIAVTLLIQSMFVVATLYTHKPITLTKGMGAPLLALSTGAVRATGTMGQSNQQAQFHLFLTLPLIGLCWLRNPYWRMGFMLTILISFVACGLTYGRAAWLTWPFAGAVMIFFAYRQGLLTRRLWSYLAVIALAGILGLLAVSKPILNRFSKKNDSGASASRLRMINVAVDYIARYPITGVGPGNFVEHNLGAVWVDRVANRWRPRDVEYVPPVTQGVEMYRWDSPAGPLVFSAIVVHNKFLLVASELGMVGLGLFCWYLWCIFQECRIAMRATRLLDQWIGIALSASFLGSLFYVQFDMLYDDKTLLVPIFMHVLIIAASRITARERALEAP